MTLDHPMLEQWRGNAALMRWASEFGIPYDELGAARSDTTHMLVEDTLFPVVP